MQSDLMQTEKVCCGSEKDHRAGSGLKPFGLQTVYRFSMESTSNYACQRARAENIRRDALKGLGMAALVKKYGMRQLAIWRILANKRCIVANAEPINATRQKMTRRAATISFFHRLGYSWKQCGLIVGTGRAYAAKVGLAYDRGQLGQCDVAVKVKLREPVGKIPAGIYTLMPLDVQNVMLLPVEPTALPITSKIVELLGKVTPYEQTHCPTTKTDSQGSL